MSVPLSGFSSLAGFHRCAPCRAAFADPKTDKQSPHAFRGLVPDDVFPAVESDLPRRTPMLPVTLRPQGFAPSRRLAPPTTCRAFFISVPPLGFTLRGFPPHCAPYGSLDRLDPQGFSPLSDEIGPALPGLYSRTTARRRVRLFTRLPPTYASVGFLLRGLLPPDRAGRFRPTCPSRALSSRPQADLDAGAPGFNSQAP